jgi:hypothetical protein
VSDWTIDTVLESHRRWARRLYEERDGVTVGVPGLSACPWCDSQMTLDDETYVATCNANGEHRAAWLPWGG